MADRHYPGWAISSILQALGALLVIIGGFIAFDGNTDGSGWMWLVIGLAGFQIFGFGTLIQLVGRICKATEQQR